MNQVANLTWELGQSLLIQIPIDRGITTPEEAALVFSGPRFFVALISGVVLAFAFQLVFTNLSVAAGISYLGHSSSDHDSHQSHSPNPGGTIRKISTAVGIWTLITVTISLFLACLLAVKLSLLTSIGFGAIVGMVIWAAYFALLVWVSSTTVGSLIGSVVNAANAGVQAIIGTASAALGAKAVNSQVVSTAEAAAAAVRRELGSAIDPSNIRDSLEDYIERIRPHQLDFGRVRGEIESLMNDPELQSVVGGGSAIEVMDRLRHIDRGTFAKLISDRSDLSKKDADRLVDQLDSVWKETVSRFNRKDPTQELVEYLKTVQSGQVNTNDLNRRLDQLTEELRRQGQTLQSTQQDQVSGMRDAISTMGQMGQSSSQGQQSLVDRAMQFGFSTLMGTVMGRTDLGDLDVEKIIGQIQSARDKVTSGVQQVADKASSSFSPIKADVENYLLNTYSWHFNRETLNNEFREVLYDPEADPAAVRRELDSLNRGDFVKLLTQRGDMSAARVSEIADQMEVIRASILSTVRVAEDQTEATDLQGRVEHYLRNTNKEELNPDAIEREVALLFEDPEAGFDALKNRLSYFNRDTLVQLLGQRQDLSPEEADQIISKVEGSRDRVLNSAQEAQNKVRSEAEAVRLRVESYLRNTNKAELDPDGIKRDFQQLIDDPQAGSAALRERLRHVDRDTIVQLLGQRQDLTPEEADRIVSQIEEARDRVIHAPQRAIAKVQDQADQVTTTIESYLRNTNLSELDPDGIKRDLNVLVSDPKAGASRLRRRLAQVDRETLVRLMAQRPDLTEDQANQLIDQVQSSIRSVVRSPRRLAARTQQRVQDFQSSFEGYLRNTDKEELNPDGIKRDLQLLLQDPKAGFGNLGDRLSHFDRSTIVALLAQRNDMTEEEANRVVDQVLAVRSQFMAQIQAIQNRIQSVIDGILDRIRNYLNSLDRPELNYDDIRMDVRTLFHDPQAGFDALRDRLGSFNRDTVVALLSSRDDISRSDANRIVDQVENARTSVLRRAERIQSDAQHRLEEVKRQAQKQAEETRKAAASAAWWLFGTAIVSAGASALAGALAVGL